MIPPGLWAAFSMVGCVLSCLSDAMRTGMCLICALSIANNWKQTRTNANKITMILYKMKQTQTVVSQLAHSFNQRARDSSSLERTKIPRRIVRFLVGFSFYSQAARSLHGRCTVHVFCVGLAAVILAQLCAETDGRYAVTGVVLGGQDMSSLVERFGFTAKGPTHRHWSACRAYL